MPRPSPKGWHQIALNLNSDSQELHPQLWFPIFRYPVNRTYYSELFAKRLRVGKSPTGIILKLKARETSTLGLRGRRLHQLHYWYWWKYQSDLELCDRAFEIWKEWTRNVAFRA